MDTYEKTISYLRKICSAREYCRRDIFAKAMKRLEDEDLALKAVAELEKDSFFSDSRYAAAFVSDKSSIDGWGPVKIRYALTVKGIPGDIITDALENSDQEKADARLRRLLESKRKMLDGDDGIKLKLLKFALSRGYGYDKVSRIVNEILNV